MKSDMESYNIMHFQLLSSSLLASLCSQYTCTCKLGSQVFCDKISCVEVYNTLMWLLITVFSHHNPTGNLFLLCT